MQREDAEKIIASALAAAQPGRAVREALETLPRYSGSLYLLAVGKAAWQMAREARELLGGKISGGAVITKYGHSKGELPGLKIFEAGHPVPDENSFRASQWALELAESLKEGDLLLLLISGGGSALFEKPLLEQEEIQDIFRRLLACGADIRETNCLRKRFSALKGGKFGALCAPAKVYSVILSDVLGDEPGTVASGPACPDLSCSAEALRIAEKYSLPLSLQARSLLLQETPKELKNCSAVISGSVRQLVAAAEGKCRELGYETYVLSDCLCCEAREAGSFLASIARCHARPGRKLAFIAGGETLVHLKGSGMGGRNQELALAAALGIEGLQNVLIFSLGSDGTDGPTDAAGGMVNGDTAEIIRSAGLDPEKALLNNDSYNALAAAGALIMTGPTGTNVNDLCAVLIN